MRVDQQLGYVIHTRPFRDTSLLVDCYTQNYGRLRLVAKGARSPKHRQRVLLQPFQLLTMDWQGRGDLKTLTGVDASQPSVKLKDDYLYSGLYINELLLHLMPTEDGTDDLFDDYQALLQLLEQRVPLQPLLRHFEINFLQSLGYGIDFSFDSHSQEPIVKEKDYVYYIGQGFIDAKTMESHNALLFNGAVLQQIARHDFSNSEVLKQAKQLTRLSIDFLLEGKVLKSREFFKQVAATRYQQ